MHGDQVVRSQEGVEFRRLQAAFVLGYSVQHDEEMVLEIIDLGEMRIRGSILDRKVAEAKPATEVLNLLRGLRDEIDPDPGVCAAVIVLQVHLNQLVVGTRNECAQHVRIIVAARPPAQDPRAMKRLEIGHSAELRQKLRDHSH